MKKSVKYWNLLKKVSRDNPPDDELSTPISSEELKKIVAEITGKMRKNKTDSN